MSACYPRRRFRAPGKLVLVGEYAVVDGAPAVVVAIDHGVECEAFPGPGPRTVEAPGDARFATAALEHVQAPGGHYVFTDWNAVELDGKPGFGGSASATVAAVLAGLACRGVIVSPNGLYDHAFAVHHAVQGSGSGIDVAAAAHGGTLRFAKGNVRPLPQIRPVVVWSGQSATTGTRIARYLAWSDRDAFVQQSTAIVERFPEAPVAALDEARRLLEDMAEATGIAYRTAALDRIALLARERGGAAKPSGAGGGDCAVALFDDPEAEAAFVLACAAEGLRVIPVEVAPAAGAVPPEAP